MLAYANSIWAFMDIAAGRPAKPGEEEVKAYGMESPLEMDYAPRKIKLPEKAILVDTFPVRKYHIDTVSYTHLDVYKRQQSGSRFLWRFSERRL